MQNLIKTNCVDNLVFRNGYEDAAPIQSAFDISGATGNIQGPNTTNKIGTGGSGSGLQLLFTTDNSPAITKITITRVGKNYKPGDVVTFSFTAADNIATGAFDITFTIPTNISDLPSAMYIPTAFNNGNSGKKYMDASTVIGWYGSDTDQLVATYLTNSIAGSGTKKFGYKIAFSGLDGSVSADEILFKEISMKISHCFRDAWQEPKSMPILNDTLKGYFETYPNIGIINITLEEVQ